MKNLKYIALSFLAIGILACENDTLDDLRNRGNTDTEPLPELTAGSADFTNYVALGASFTAGFSDGTVFLAAQENSFPKIMADKFALTGGGTFTQPLVSDNFGGLAAGGTRIADPRLVFGGAGPVGLESIIGPVTVGTDIVLNNPTGPFNNLGIPGAKSFHLVAPGYGNISNFPAAANPYAVRVTGNAPNATILELALAQNPSFFSISEIGGNDVLGYATSGGDGTNPITDSATFDASLNAIVAGMTANGAKGVIGNLPDITSLSHFTTVPHNPLEPSNPAFGPLIPTLNTLYGALNDVYAFLEFQGAIDDAATRTVVFSDSQANAVVIVDENLDNISALITQTLLGNPQFPAFITQFGLPAAAAPQVAGLLGLVYGQARQATPDDLFVLPSSSVIGTVNSEFSLFLQSQGIPAATADQFAAEGVTLPLEDKWSLVPEEQMEIAVATDAYNATISSVASTNGLALVDLNAILEEAASTGIIFDDFIHTTDLVFGGLVSLDGIHLTSRGYALMANAFLQAIDTTYGSNFEASGNLAKADDYITNYSPLLQ
ncbi:SGNH/GDSL hydrolase family protein [Winogradskyella alexanderae]|uniref:G-D-S-L family lipolytic protein n=1 Tax=Winogradskyella alexanderae TaxID=2877123 RepID=A0ABS7XQX8_9FLAO|nr:G-D-S-L family lipolytic protein [Winogradskyella alexanderae]MCA0131451.1 G-D-S-L family lipolytic protein [Winogradskyella alexanderae]